MAGNNQNQSHSVATDAPHESIREIIYQIRRLMQAGSLYTKELNRNYQVSAPQLNCIITLYENGPMPPSKIAKRIMVKSSTVTGIIDRLEYKGLVKRTRNSSDRRVITIELTSTGRVLAENAPPPIQQKIVEGLQRLHADKLEQIVSNMRLLTHMLDDSDFEAEHPEDTHPL